MSNDFSKKIVQQALSFTKPDRLPVFEGYIRQEFIEKWRQERSIPEHDTFDAHFGCDLCTLRPTEQFFPTRMRRIRDDGQYAYSDDGWGRIVKERKDANFKEPVERILNAPADLDNIHFDSPLLDGRYAGMAEVAAQSHKAGKAVFVNTGGPFIRSSFLRGETEFLMDLVEDEQFAAAIVHKVAEHLLAVGLEALKRANAYDCGIWIYDDMCSSKAPMFSPSVFERVFLPVYQPMVSTLKSAGAKWVILHCDGNLTPFLDLLLEAGIDGINPVEYAAGMNVCDLLNKYYGRLRFIGGVCNTHILPSSDFESIRRHVEMIVDAGVNGGLVAGTHSVGTDISVASYELYRKILAERGDYLASRRSHA